MPIEDILAQIRDLVNAGAKEIILIAQDTTRYGVDLYKRPYLFELLQQIEELDGDFVYRILYLYPDVVSLKQLEKLKQFKKFIPYFDIPLQHISSKLLKSMGRFYDIDFIYKFLDFIEQNWEQKFVRTNFIVGFPGESEEDFAQLLEFARQDRFDNIAIFEYHDEPLASSYKLDGKVSSDIIRERFSRLKEVVDRMLEMRWARQKGKVWQGFVMGFEGEKVLIRPTLHAPEIDPYHLVGLENIKKGNVEIGEVVEYVY